MRTIATHVWPDLDAGLSVWLLKQFTMACADAQVVFVNTGNPDPDTLVRASAVVDTGGIWEPLTLRFDHHQLPGEQANATCAAMQVYEYLLSVGEDIAHLEPLVKLVFAGDTGRPQADESRLIGLHALVSSQRRRLNDERMNDNEASHVLMEFMFWLFEEVERGLGIKAAAAAALEDSVAWQSDDGRFVALTDDAGGSLTFAAFDAGYEVAMFHTSTTNTIGVQRARGSELNMGAVVRRAIELTGCPDIRAELESWYCHESGFFAGRGTRKAPREDMIGAPPMEIAEILAFALNQ